MTPEAMLRDKSRAQNFCSEARFMLAEAQQAKEYSQLRDRLMGIGAAWAYDIDTSLFLSPVDRREPDAVVHLSCGVTLFNLPGDTGRLFFQPGLMTETTHFRRDQANLMLKSMGVDTHICGDDCRETKTIVKGPDQDTPPVVVKGRLSGAVLATQVCMADRALGLALGCIPDHLLPETKNGIVESVKTPTSEGFEIIAFAIPQPDKTLVAPSFYLSHGTTPPQARENEIVRLLTYSGFKPFGIQFDLTRFERNTIRKVSHLAQTGVIYASYVIRRGIKDLAERI